MPRILCMYRISKLAAPLIYLMVMLWNMPANIADLHKQRIVSDAAGLEGAAISPDGSKVAIYFSNRLEIHDVSSLRVIASVQLPLIPAGRHLGEGMPESGVRYCDRGKYILIYGGSATFFVIDAVGSRRAATIDLDIPKAEKTTATLIAGSCAAESNIAVIEVSPSQYDWVKTVKVFDHDSAKEIGEIPLGSRHVPWRGVEVSPSGSHALIYLGDADNPHSSIALLDIGSSKLSASIDTEFYGGQATFVGESAVAVVGGDFRRADAREVTMIFDAKTGALKRKFADAHGTIKIFDVQTGALTREIGDSNNAPKAAVEASVDGRLLFAYTGKENDCEECDDRSRGNLEITHAKFTVWDLITGKVVAESPGIRTLTENDPMFLFVRVPMLLGDALSGKSSRRPQFQFSQSGNAILVTGTRDENSVDVYLLK